jgi:hypothetical protein
MVDKKKTPYFFSEGGMTIWLTDQQYFSLRQKFLDLAEAGSPVAAARLQGFGPEPQA